MLYLGIWRKKQNLTRKHVQTVFKYRLQSTSLFLFFGNTGNRGDKVQLNSRHVLPPPTKTEKAGMDSGQQEGPATGPRWRRPFSEPQRTRQNRPPPLPEQNKCLHANAARV